MSEIVHVLVIYLNKHDKYLILSHNSQYDIITRYYSDNNYKNILPKFNVIVVIGKYEDNVDLTPVLDLANKLGIKTFLPKEYSFDIPELEKMLLKFIQNNEHIKIKRAFFDNKKMVMIVGTEKYKNVLIKQEFLKKMEMVISWNVLNINRGGGSEITKTENTFIIINSEFRLYKSIKEQLEKTGFIENIDFTSLEDYCYITDRASEILPQWGQIEQNDVVTIKKLLGDGMIERNLCPNGFYLI